MISKISSSYSSRNFYSRSLIYAVLSVAAAAFNYLLYPTVARTLSVSQFGEFVVLISLVTQISGMFIAFSVLSLYFGSNKTVGSKDDINKIQKGLFFLVAVLCLIVSVFSPLFTDLLNLSLPIYLLIAVATILLSIPSSFWTGYLQGAGEYQRVGIFSVAGAAFKLILVVILGSLMTLTGTLLAVFVSSLLALALFWVLPGEKPPVFSGLILKRSDWLVIRKYRKIIYSFLVSTFLLLVAQIFDVTSIKIMLDAHSSGIYAGISTIAKIVFFVGAIIIWIVLPEIAKPDRAHSKKMINKTYLLLAIISFGFILLLKFAGSFITELALGSDYSGHTAMLIWSALFQVGILFLTFQTLTLLVLGRRRFIALLILLIIGFFIASSLGNGIESLIGLYSVITMVVCGLMGVMIRIDNHEEENN